MGKTVLIVGGSGYLGQFLLQELLLQGHRVSYTYQANALPGSDAKGFKASQVPGRAEWCG